MADNEIIVRFENVLVGGSGTGGTTGAQGVPMAGVQQAQAISASNAFLQGVSAQMLMGGVTRIISATGNTELSSALEKGVSYAFLGSRVLASGGMDVGADIALLIKAVADITQAVTKSNAEKKELAQQANALDMLRFRGGAFSINANTQISSNRYGRVSFIERK